MSAATNRASRLVRLLTVAAFALGALAVVGDPHGGPVVRLDTRELAGIVQTEVDHVTAPELADWIIRGDTEYRLIDLRDEASFATYHIPTAEHVPLAELPDYPLLRNERIVLYSDGGIHSAQAWFLMMAQGFRGSYMLLGGLDAWKDEVLFPALPNDASAERVADFERAGAVAEFFGGAPQTGVDRADAGVELALPRVEMPSQPVVPQRKKRKKEGC